MTKKVGDNEIEKKRKRDKCDIGRKDIDRERKRDGMTERVRYTLKS